MSSFFFSPTQSYLEDVGQALVKVCDNAQFRRLLWPHFLLVRLQPVKDVPT